VEDDWAEAGVEVYFGGGAGARTEGEEHELRGEDGLRGRSTDWVGERIGLRPVTSTGSESGICWHDATGKPQGRG